MRLQLRVVLAIGLLVTASACGDTAVGPSNPAITESPTTTPIAATTSTATSTPSTTSTVATTEPSTPTTATTTTLPIPTVDVKIYLLRDARLVIAHRKVLGPDLLRAALTALLAGPTGDEQHSGLITTVPSDTRLLNVSETGGLAAVDLSGEFATGGGTLSMQSRLAEIVFTATQFAGTERVAFRLDGTSLNVLGGEGLAVTEPQSRMMVDRTLSGSVLIDTPSPGAKVSSPFTVTGEGDVYEGEFPIEVWSGDQQIGGVAPVRSGAWGTWAPFEATITVDASPGPIQLIAYDPGGCGTDPECPPIVKTIVELTLAG